MSTIRWWAGIVAGATLVAISLPAFSGSALADDANPPASGAPVAIMPVADLPSTDVVAGTELTADPVAAIEADTPVAADAAAPVAAADGAPAPSDAQTDAPDGVPASDTPVAAESEGETATTAEPVASAPDESAAPATGSAPAPADTDATPTEATPTDATPADGTPSDTTVTPLAGLGVTVGATPNVDPQGYIVTSSDDVFAPTTAFTMQYSVKIKNLSAYPFSDVVASVNAGTTGLTFSCSLFGQDAGARLLGPWNLAIGTLAAGAEMDCSGTYTIPEGATAWSDVILGPTFSVNVTATASVDGQTVPVTVTDDDPAWGPSQTGVSYTARNAADYLPLPGLLTTLTVAPASSSVRLAGTNSNGVMIFLPENSAVTFTLTIKNVYATKVFDVLVPVSFVGPGAAPVFSCALSGTDDAGKPVSNKPVNILDGSLVMNHGDLVTCSASGVTSAAQATLSVAPSGMTIFGMFERAITVTDAAHGGASVTSVTFTCGGPIIPEPALAWQPNADTGGTASASNAAGVAAVVLLAAGLGALVVGRRRLLSAVVR